MWKWEAWENLGKEKNSWGNKRKEVVGLRSSWEAHSWQAEGSGLLEKFSENNKLRPFRGLEGGVFLKG